MTQSTMSDQNPVIIDTPNSDAEPISEPMAIHGARRPQRLRVRSDRAPAIGVASVEKTEVIAKRSARLFSLDAGESSAIWLGSSTPSTPL